MPLFNTKTVNAALAAYRRDPTADERACAAKWAAQARIDFNGQNESQLEPELNAVLMQGALGYRALGPDGPGTIKAKQAVGGGTVDLAIGNFTAVTATILAPFELKGPKTGLDAIMAGRAKTPVQQAWEYANDAIGARWVLVSNMRELRLYAVGHGRAAYETFDLRRIDDVAELKRLQLFLHADQFLGGATADLLTRSASEDRDITDRLYRDYKTLRGDLIQFVRDQRPHVEAEARIALVQKLLDRLIFVAFAEDSVLLPKASIRRAVEFADPYNPRPKWTRICSLFSAVDNGHPATLGIDAYNGGLFAPDADHDALDLPDHLVERFLDIAAYDFQSQVSVSILGHIFEQSISDIEAMQAEARGEEPPKAGKRKRDGVVYTPEFVTAFIVERTIGTHLKEIADALLTEHATGTDDDGIVTWKTKASERDYWRAYLDSVTSLRIVDPACGSGAFLIAAFDFLHAEQRRVRERLGEIDGGLLAWAEANADVEIITRNLYGVDVNAESVEITRLALWLKTAKKGRPLESLDLNIRCGNSLIEDSDFHARAFVWERDFAGGPFDIVLGNPPYVRMELLKPIKPYLEKRYAVVSDRADLYAYFFELGVRVLKPGGRLGYISSSTFFRTGSGAPLRAFLSESAELETVVDFGDLQIFEGVTTYPAILTLRKAGGDAGVETLRFFNVKMLPADLSLAFDEIAEHMPRDCLGRGSWCFEGPVLRAIRAKVKGHHKTLADLVGAPLLGVKTGRDEPFLINRATAAEIVKSDSKSSKLLRTHLVGDDLERWFHERPDRIAIYIKKREIRIDDYPAIKAHLTPFKADLEKRATSQQFFEWQQAEAIGRDDFTSPKICYPLMSQGPKFSIELTGALTNQNSFIIKTADYSLLALLNSKVAWFFLSGIADSLRGGVWRLVLKSQFVAQVPIPEMTDSEQKALADAAVLASNAAEALFDLALSVLHRLADISPYIEAAAVFRAWPDLEFAQLRALITKRCKTDIALAERDAWEGWFAGKRAEAAALRARVADAEAEINERTYALFGLDAYEVAAIEESLAGQY